MGDEFGEACIADRPADAGPKLAHPDSATLFFALWPVSFLFVHPHPWPYMLAIPAPFVALLIVRQATRLGRVRARWGGRRRVRPGGGVGHRTR